MEEHEPADAAPFGQAGRAPPCALHPISSSRLNQDERWFALLTETQDTPVARADGPGYWCPCRWAMTDQPVVTAVSSTTNEVCSEESSVPVNLRVTDWPARLPSEKLCWV